MRHCDQFGYDLTINTPNAVSAWDEAVSAFLAHGRETPVHLEVALTTDPRFVLGHAARGLFCLLLGRKELNDTARDCLALAQKAAAEVGATTREKAVIGALSDWLDGWPSRSANRLDQALQDHPRDGFLMKLVHAIRFVLGDAAGMRASVDSVANHYDSSHPSYGYFLGCRAFTLEESGDYRQAEKLGRAGLEHSPDDAWGLHAVAHVHDMTGRAEEGIGWLESRPESWKHCNNFGYHVWWHLALMHLDRGNIDKVLQLYDQEIRRDRTDDYRDISNATSLLARLELEGVNIGHRWEELSQISDKRAEDACNVFADLHYLLALLNGGRRMGAERLLNSMARREADSGDVGRVSSHPGHSAALGLEQFRKGNYGSAFHLLSSARSDMPTIGGSHAQRDVFERMTIDAALRAGLADAAEVILKDRGRKRGGLDQYAETRLATAEKMRSAAKIMLNQDLRVPQA
ncbi:tetratricopeptide repeat protein [Roseibium sp. CAU 1637]|uniref:Tetratricopeptide repeat protein 38 n=1 Tax=Roseibium limicola TaxID=2816037 RepID=A0A939EQ38_9HYPH|nr:tetratricopeptide repeat protein [Roseibium limicola]MBO0346527.1 tetratricopeptide repeat protein [Roseibium limicola]